MKILTAQQMREIDRLTVERCGIPYTTLMETAGSRVVAAIIENYGSVVGRNFLVYCGKGNNGGDGAVIARLLWELGAKNVSVMLFGSIEETKGEARTNFEIINRIAKAEEERRQELDRRQKIDHEKVDLLSLERYLPRMSFVESQTTSGMLLRDEKTEFVIDALLGTGLRSPTKGLYEIAVNAINLFRGLGAKDGKFLKVISVDIPSGLSSDASHPIGPHVNADLTVSFTAPKLGNVLPPASEINGKLIIASIGTPGWLVEEESGSFVTLVDEKQIATWLRESRRAPGAHKGSVGDVLLVAGSRGKTGAAALASETVLRAGAGLVTVATPRSAQPLLITQTINEVMTEALDETQSGMVAHTALDRALQLAEKRTVLALGPGLSSSEESTSRFVRGLVERRTVPMVLDADGLNALAPWPDGLAGSDDLPIIITPHPGEMARLTGKTNAEILVDRISSAREFATKHHVITVLKGNRSIIAAPNGEIYINPTGNAGMATAGSGDVLTGLIAGLLAQSPKTVLDATIAGVYLHGLAGDLAANKLGMRSMIASDIIAHLSDAFLSTGGDAERGSINPITTI